MGDMEELMRPQWLGALESCPFCHGEAEVEYDPMNPRAAVWDCGSCGASGVASPPADEVPAEMVIVI